MEITEIKVFPVREEKLKAFVSVVFDECFMVNDIKVIKGREGFFISMPSRKKKNGKFKDVAHPLNNETRQMIESQILAEYDQALDRQAQEAASESQGERQAEAPIFVQPDRRPVLRPALGEEPAAEPAAEPPAEKSLDEVAEIHLGDSFWNT